MKGNHWSLNRKGNEEGREKTNLDSHGKANGSGREGIDHEERVSTASSQGPNSNQAAEHDQTASQREEQELHCCTLTRLLFTNSVTTNHHEERNQHSFECQVEEQDIRSGEDQHHEGFQEQNPTEVSTGTSRILVLIPSGHDDQGNQGDGQKDHHQAKSIHGQRPTQANLGNPGIGLGKLVGGGMRPVECNRSNDGHDQLTQRKNEREGTPCLAQGWNRQKKHCTQCGKCNKNRQPR